MKYKEILELNEYCKKIGVHTVLEPLFDGYAIRFNNGADVVQHQYSYGSKRGCLEPAMGSKTKDYNAVTLKTAKEMVYRRKKQLNRKGDA